MTSIRKTRKKLLKWWRYTTKHGENFRASRGFEKALNKLAAKISYRNSKES